jgi:hypothetical protein
MNEAAACVPVPIDPNAFNPSVQLPYGLTTHHVRQAMESFTAFLASRSRLASALWSARK